jgi:putative transposase
VIGDADDHKYLIPDRDSIFARHLDDSIRGWASWCCAHHTRAPRRNAICERGIGTIRRECLDSMIPLSESYLRSILRELACSYDGKRPHSALGPGEPGPPAGAARVARP